LAASALTTGAILIASGRVPMTQRMWLHRPIAPPTAPVRDFTRRLNRKPFAASGNGCYSDLMTAIPRSAKWWWPV
jgi:hypothetical protein